MHAIWSIWRNHLISGMGQTDRRADRPLKDEIEHLARYSNFTDSDFKYR